MSVVANQSNLELRDKVMLTVPEAAQLLSISRAKAYELIAQGKLPAVDLGTRCLRVPRAKLDQWAVQITEEGMPLAANAC